jgi:hypothetical protein
MYSEKKQNESAPTNKLNEAANENYKKLSDEFAKSMQQHVQAISELQQEYMESIKVAYESTISLQKEYFQILNHTTRYLVLQRQIQKI